MRPTSSVMLFCGSTKMPDGGWEDFKGRFRNLNEVKIWVALNYPRATFMWAHVVFRDRIILRAYEHREEEHEGEWLWTNEEE